MAKREEYMTRMKERLAQWNSKLEALRAKAGDTVKAEYQKQLEEWKAGAKLVADKLTELKAADDKWYVIKRDLEKALHAIETALGGPDPAKSAPKDAPARTPPATGSKPTLVAPAAEEAAEPTDASRRSAQ